MSADDLAESQRAIVNVYTLIAMLYCAASAWLYYQVVDIPFLGLVHLVSLGVIGVNYVVLQFTKNYGWATHVILSVGTLVVTSQYATGGWGGTGFLWTFAYLPYLFFLASKTAARLWVAVLLAVDIGITLADATGRYDVPYDAVGHGIFYASLGIFLLCMFLFKHAVLVSEGTAQRRATELTVLNQELSRREEELNQAQRLARLGSWTWNPATDESQVSIQMQELFGLRAGDPPINLAAVRKYVHPEDREHLDATLKNAVEAGLPMELDFRIIRTDGSVRTLHSRGTPERNPAGDLVRYVGTSQDVTDVRAAEAERRLAAVRMQEIEGLKEVNRFKSTFLNTAAHELSTPLTPIRLQLHTLRTAGPTAPPEKRQHALELLERNVHRLAALVQDLLEGAKLQSSQLAIERRPVDLAKLVEDGVRNQMPVAKDRGVELILQASPPLTTQGDARRLAQVIDNLLANAVKFTPPGKAVHVRTVRASGGVAVFVQDEGIGLSPAGLTKLFQPFSQVHDTSQQTRAGTGLGLYISKGIIEAHGGRMGAESPGLGQGATFWFVLGEGEAADLPPAPS